MNIIENKQIDTDIYKEIKNDLLQTGGLIITQRQVGKSLALISIIIDNPNAIIVTFNKKNKENLMHLYANNFLTHYEKYHDSINDRIYSSNSTSFDIKELNEKYDVYIDEYYFHRNLFKEFKGAVSTMDFPVRIIKYSNVNVTEEMKKISGERFWETEYNLYE